MLASTEAIPPASTARRLSRREQSVLQQIAAGHTNRGIAKFLGMEGTAVETYEWRLREKLGLATRLDVVRYAVSTVLLTSLSEVTSTGIGKNRRSKHPPQIILQKYVTHDAVRCNLTEPSSWLHPPFKPRVERSIPSQIVVKPPGGFS